MNREYKTNKLRYAYQSLVTPASVFDYDVEKHTSTLLKQTEVPGGYDPAKYQSERVWATAKDGVKVPVSLVYRKDLKKADGSNPLYVYAYGSYGVILPVTFSSSRLSLLDRGVVMAFAHIRGGGDLGKPWHDAGRMMNKMNTFTDFIACTEYLVANKYGARDKIAIEGGSGRTADGRGHQPASRPVQGRGLARAVRRRDEHHARRVPAAHRAASMRSGAIPMRSRRTTTC